ncbi:NAD(P)-binding protein [Martensiomyces pterosporus]|nr:NAD(P)-binding protein [Martensiomyces pterosporus]
MTLIDIQGKVAVVTGGAQSMGLLTAQTLVSKGARVVIGDVLPSGADEVAKMNEEAGSQVAVFQLCDVRDVSSLQSLLDRAVSEFGSLDILVNNAGVLDKPWDQDPAGEYASRCIDINVRALINGTTRALNYWNKDESRKGIVINLASTAGYTPLGLMAAYTASKAAVVMYTKSLAGLAPKVRVNAVAPSWVDTKFVDAEHIGKSHDLVKYTGLLRTEEVVAQIVRLIEDESLAGDIVILSSGKEPRTCTMPKATDVEARIAAELAAAAKAGN